VVERPGVSALDPPFGRSRPGLPTGNAPRISGEGRAGRATARPAAGRARVNRAETPWRGPQPEARTRGRRSRRPRAAACRLTRGRPDAGRTSGMAKSSGRGERASARRSPDLAADHHDRRRRSPLPGNGSRRARGL